MSIVSLLILTVAIYCSFKQLNKTASKAVQVFNEQHQLVQQNLSTQSSLNSNNLQNYTTNQAIIYNNNQIVRELPKIPSLYNENIYDTLTALNEPRYVDFKFYSIDRNKKQQQPSTWNQLKRKLSRQDIDDLNSESYRRANTDSCEYDYIDLKANDQPVYKNLIDSQSISYAKESTFKPNVNHNTK